MANIPGTSKADRLRGTKDADTINGGAGNDHISGGDGRDVLRGGDGNDYIEGGGQQQDFATAKARNDVIDGGAGTDTAVIDYSNLIWAATDKPIKINFTFSTSTFQIQVDGFTGATVSNCEKIKIWLANGDDNAVLGDNADWVNAGYGNDMIRAGKGNDLVHDTGGKADFNGGDGIDRLSLEYLNFTWDMSFDLVTGNITASGELNGQPVDPNYGKALNFERLDFNGGWGNDTAKGGALADSFRDTEGGTNYFDGRGGNDTMTVQTQGAHTLIGGDGNDHLWSIYGGSSGHLTLDAGAGDDRLEVGGSGTNRLTAGDGNDEVVGPSTIFDDTVLGGRGSDRVEIGGAYYQTVRGLLDGGSGTDLLVWNGFVPGGTFDSNLGSQDVRATQVADAYDNYVVTVQKFESFEIRGTHLNETIKTGDRNDVLVGNGGADVLWGRGGNDVLEGGEGADSIALGLGNDALVFSDLYIGNGVHTISDFNPADDEIRFDAFFDDGLPLGPLAANRFVANNAPVASGARAQFLYDRNDGLLSYDSDGAGTDVAILLATFTNKAYLTAADFVVV
jgi:Ca2+-binding RTX toxin-like protein